MLYSWEFWQKFLPFLSPFLGFLSGWGLFELTERRKVRLAQRALREALVAELQIVEVLLSTIVGKYAYVVKNADEAKNVAHEIRWFVKVGKKRVQGLGLALAEAPEGASDRFDALPDDQVVAVFAEMMPKETVGVKLILPVVEAALAGRTSGFSATEIQALSTVRWQVYLLEQDAEWMAEFLRLTFTVTDAENHAVVSKNHEQRTQSYARRAAVVLRCVRTALATLGASDMVEV